MDGKWGPTNTGIVFRDSFTGTTFDRPGFQELLRFCESNKQDKKPQKGVIEVYDMSRFGRILTAGEEDPEAVLGMLRHLHRLGWEVRFTTFESTGNKVMDFFQNGLYSIMASEVSKKLSRDVRRGRNHFLTLEGGGRWMGGSKPPFGTNRVDPETGKILAPRERAIGRGGTLLIPNEEELALWHECAHMLLDQDAGLTKIAEFLNAKGARREYGSRWEHNAVRIVLSNPVLIGELHIDHTDAATDEVTTKIYKAAWDPMVDVDLFRRVVAKLKERHEERRRGSRDGYLKSLLAPICAHCGAQYYATRYSSFKIGKGGKKVPRVLTAYAHPTAVHLGHRYWAKKIKETGCKKWVVPTEVLENSVRDLILQSRATEDFAAHLMALIEERGDLEDAATKQRAEAERRLKALQREHVLTIQNMTKAQTLGIDDAAFWEKLTALNEEIAVVQKEREAAIDLESVANSAWDNVRDLIDETKNLASIWEHGTFERRREIVSWWVRQILIVVEQEPGKRRSARKHAVVFLRTAPTEGIDSLVAGTPLIGAIGSKGTPASVSNNGSVYLRTLPTFKQKIAAWQRLTRWLPANSPEVEALLGGHPVPVEPLETRWKRAK